MRSDPGALKTPPRNPSHNPRQEKRQDSTDRSRNSSRGSAYSRNSSRGSAYSNRSGSNDSQYRALQTHSSLSKSSRRNEQVQIPSIYRSKSPGTVASLHKHYFIPGDGCEKYADWKTRGNCLRCYSSQHRAKDCPVYRESCSSPCKMCVHLWHRSQLCNRYELNGKTKIIKKIRTAYLFKHKVPNS